MQKPTDAPREPGIDVPAKPGQPTPYPTNPDLPGGQPQPIDPGQGQPVPARPDTTQPGATPDTDPLKREPPGEFSRIPDNDVGKGGRPSGRP